MSATELSPPVPPGSPPPTSTVEPATTRLLVVALTVGAGVDLALRSGVVGLAGSLTVLLATVALLASGRLRSTESRVLAALAPVFGTWLCLRTSDWLVPLDLLAAAGLLAAGAAVSRGGSLLDVGLGDLVRWFGTVVPSWFEVPRFVAPLVPSGERARSIAPVARGAALAIPVLAVLGALLASADAVFASFLAVDLDGADLLLHAVLVVVGGWSLLTLLRLASAPPTRVVRTPRSRIGRAEVSVVLGGVIALFGAFAVAQVVAIAGGAQHVLDTRGLTYAEYARSGFFQLLWVAALTVGLLLAMRAVTSDDEPAQRRFRRLALCVVALTLVIVAVSIRRLGLYQDAFGLTMLRLYCTLFAGWIGFVVLAVGATIAGVHRSSRWLFGASAAAGLGLLLVLNVANPEAIVARHNLARIADGREVDSAYLAEGLSRDAVPTIVDRLPTLDPATRADLEARMGCLEPSDGWPAWNASRDAAAAATDRVCGTERAR